MRELLSKLRENKIHVSLENENLKIKFDDKEISNVFLEEIKRNKEQIIAFLKDSIKSHNVYQPILHTRKSEWYPLSSSQYRLWILCQLDGGLLAYNIPAVLKLKGAIDSHKFEESFRILINRHEILRTCFRTNQKSEVSQYILPISSIDFRIQIEDFTAIENQNEIVSAYLDEKNSIPFDLEQGPLLRVYLIKLEEEKYIFYLSTHHIIIDGWSMQLLLSEVTEIYGALIQNTTVNLPELTIHYKDYSAWLTLPEQEEKQRASEAYWLDQFKGDLPVLVVPANKTRPLIQTYNGDTITQQFSKGFLNKLNTFSKEQDITLYVTLISGITSLLNRYTGQNDIIIGTPIAGREHPDLENQLGLYLNTLAIRTQFENGFTFLDLLKKEKQTILKAHEHQSYPFAELVAKLNLKRDPSRSILFDVMMDLRNQPQTKNTDNASAGFEISNYEFKSKTAKNDINFAFTETTELGLSIDYNTDIYQGHSIKKMFSHFENLLTQLIDYPNVDIQQLEYLTSEEKDQLLFGFNATEENYPDKNILGLFQEQVQLSGSEIAVISESIKLTYKELDDLSNQFSHCLKDNYGISKGDKVGIQLNKNEWAIISILGILKAGGTYIPIDAELPNKRKSFIIEDTALQLLITEASYALDLFDFYEGRTHAIDVEFDPSQFSSEALNLVLSKDDLAYIIYTSGSTGQPKGVMIEHGSFMNYITWAKSFYLSGNPANTNFGLFTSLSFDLTITSLFLPILSGGILEFFSSDSEISNVLKQYLSSNISCIKLTPAHISVLDNLGIKSDSLEIAIVGGEELRQTHVSILKKINPSIKIYNEYGPTEATVGCTIYEVKSSEETILIGKPVANTSIYILNPSNVLQPCGISGEIYIGGSSLARGYVNRTDLTEEKFIENPFNKKERLYKTGDLGKWLPDGNIEYLGRLDHQVKIRGYRIELGEIESAILEYSEELKQVIIDVREINNEKALVAYFVSESNIDKSTLRNFLLVRLPEYMIPVFYVAMESFPLTSNGKINRKALPNVEGEDLIRKEHKAPTNEIEEKLVTIWQDSLGINEISILDNFFELGGDSLKAIRLISQIHKIFDVKLDLKEVFSKAILEDQAVLIAQGNRISFSGIPILPESKSYKLSSSQRRLWVLSQFTESNVAYNIPDVYEFVGNLNTQALSASFTALLERHEILRTVFKEVENGEVKQFVQSVADSGFTLAYDDLRNENDKDQKISEHIQLNFLEPFDLSNGPLIRGNIYQIADDKWIFTYVMHHIISDGWSMEILINEVLRNYNAFTNNVSNPATPLRIQYKDFAAWQQDQLNSEELEGHKTYWLNQLSGELPVLDLQGDYIRPSIKTNNGKIVNKVFNSDILNGIKLLAQEQGGTLFMALLTAVNTLLHRYTNQEDIIIGSVVAGRDHADLEDQIGFYVNTLALRTQFSGSNTYKEVLEQVKETTLDAYKHQSYPFDELIDALDLQRDMSRNPLFEAVVVLQNAIKNDNNHSLNELLVNPYKNKQNVNSKFDLLFNFAESGDSLELILQYNRDIYTVETIQLLVLHLEQLLEAIIANPIVPINKLQYIGNEELHELLYEFNNTDTVYPADKSIVDLFQEQVKRNPDATAVVFENERLTYNDLNDKSNQLAHHLVHGLGVQNGDTVGIMLDRSEKILISIFAILKSGAAYVPIDSDYPKLRKDYIIEDTDIKVLITQSDLISDLDYTGVIFKMDTQFESLTADVIAIDTVIKPDNLAYIMYTSGSTGAPKGVMVEHQNVVRLVKQTNYVAFNGDDVILSLSNFAFDGSVFDIFGALLNGGSIIVPLKEVFLDSDQLGEILRSEKVSMFFITTALFNSFVDNVKIDLPDLKYILFGGELVSLEHTRKFKNLRPSVHLHHVYGPTENTTFSTYYSIDSIRDNATTIPIGQPISNSKVYVIDAMNSLCSRGVVGEICVSGDGLARGYLNKPELTAEKFVDNPFETGTKMYRTGDLGRWLPDGSIEFIGRRDAQVKIRGFRIELGEIENALGKQPGIITNVVLALTTASGDKELVAYFTADENLSTTTIRSSLNKFLPGYMIPSYYIQLEKFPLNSSGKIDKKLLPQPVGDDLLSSTEYVMPRNETEEQLLYIWKELLGKEKISVTDNFFEIGGHSLKAIRLIGQIHKIFNVKIDLKSIFSKPTLEDQAILIAQEHRSAFLNIAPLPESASYELSSSQLRLWVLSQFEESNVAYNMPDVYVFEGNLDVDALSFSFETLLQRHEILRTIFKQDNDGKVQQYIQSLETVEFKIGFENLRNKKNSEELASQFIKSDFSKPFNLAEDLLLRAHIYQISDHKWIFTYVMHHIISDGWSMGILLKELLQNYNAKIKEELSVSEPLSIQYKDFAAWQKEQLSGEKLQYHKTYWLDQFVGELPILELSGDYSRPLVKTYNGGLVTRKVNSNLIKGIKTLCNEQGSTLFMGLLAAVNTLLYRSTNQEDIILGSVIAGREHADLEDQIGFYVNTLALRMQFEGSNSYSELLNKAKEVTLGAYEHQIYPFDELVDTLQPKRDMSRNPLFDVTIVLQNSETYSDNEFSDLIDLSVRSYEGEKTVKSKFDLAFEFIEIDSELQVGITYNTDIYTNSTVERLLNHFEQLLEAIVAKPHTSIAELSYLTAQETHQLLEIFNATTVSYPEDKTIVDLFEAQVLRTPNNIAVVYEDVRLTYQELNERANQLGAYLRVTYGVGPDDLIGIRLERSELMLISILGILKAGGAYVPIDPGYPAERISYIEKDSNCKVVIDREELLSFDKVCTDF
ncbi:amino acid adenylation domain-containing protein, partial [Flavobacterium psychroterrae]